MEARRRGRTIVGPLRSEPGPGVSVVLFGSDLSNVICALAGGRRSPKLAKLTEPNATSRHGDVVARVAK